MRSKITSILCVLSIFACELIDNGYAVQKDLSKKASTQNPRRTTSASGKEKSSTSTKIALQLRKSEDNAKSGTSAQSAAQNSEQQPIVSEDMIGKANENINKSGLVKKEICSSNQLLDYLKWKNHDTYIRIVKTQSQGSISNLTILDSTLREQFYPDFVRALRLRADIVRILNDVLTGAEFIQADMPQKPQPQEIDLQTFQKIQNFIRTTIDSIPTDPSVIGFFGRIENRQWNYQSGSTNCFITIIKPAINEGFIAKKTGNQIGYTGILEKTYNKIRMRWLYDITGQNARYTSIWAGRLGTQLKVYLGQPQRKVQLKHVTNDNLADVPPSKAKIQISSPSTFEKSVKTSHVDVETQNGRQQQLQISATQTQKNIPETTPIAKSAPSTPPQKQRKASSPLRQRPAWNAGFQNTGPAAGEFGNVFAGTSDYESNGRRGDTPFIKNSSKTVKDNGDRLQHWSPNRSPKYQ